MPHNEAKRKISELKSELENTPKETSAFEEALSNAQEELERFTPDAVREFSETLKREAAEFEVDHPRVTALINNVMTSLSNLGI